MQIEYSSALRKKLKDNKTIKKYYPQDEQSIIFLLSVLQGASTLNDVPNTPPIRRHKLSSNRKDCWAVDISKNRRMIIEPIDGKEPFEITSVRVLEIIDYH